MYPGADPEGDPEGGFGDVKKILKLGKNPITVEIFP